MKSNKSPTNTNVLDKVIVSINVGGGMTQDITTQVKKIDISETITGSLAGTLDIEDDQGIIDNLYLTGDEVINISFTYMEMEVKAAFFFNGISNINTTSSTHRKDYQIMLGSVEDYVDATNLCSKCYDGAPQDMIAAIYEDFFVPFNQGLVIFTGSASPGNRFIVPTISPKKAVEQIRIRMYDLEKTGFVLFERLVDANTSYLVSLGDLGARDAIGTLEPSIESITGLTKGSPIAFNMGRITGNIVMNDNINLIDKASSGIYGKRIQTIDLANTEDHEQIFTQKSRPAVNKLRAYRPNLYGDNACQLNCADDMNIATSNYRSSVSFGINTVCTGVIPIVGMGVGDTVNLNINDSTVTRKNSGIDSSLKYSTKYMVTNINHIIKDGLYIQNLTLVTGDF